MARARGREERRSDDLMVAAVKKQMLTKIDAAMQLAVAGTRGVTVRLSANESFTWHLNLVNLARSFWGLRYTRSLFQFLSPPCLLAPASNCRCLKSTSGRHFITTIEREGGATKSKYSIYLAARHHCVWPASSSRGTAPPPSPPPLRSTSHSLPTSLPLFSTDDP
jgi:hypothetical protein